MIKTLGTEDTLENAGFLLGNTADCLSQLTLMVDTQTGYTNDFRTNHVSAV